MNTLYWILLCVGLLFLGGILAYFLMGLMSTANDYDGTIFVTKTEDKLIYRMEINDSPEILEFMPQVIFKVQKTPESE